MNILVSNDDGIYAKGIKVLVDSLKENGHTVYVVAPLEEQSGTGHGVTLHTPLRVTEAYREDGFFGYSINGKPADCVKVACNYIYKDIEFDFLIAGINRGANLGTDLFYSGTFSAAAEGALLGLRSIAVSLTDPNNDPYFETAAKFIIEYLENIKNVEFPKDSLININVPNVHWEDIKGYKYSVQGNRRFRDNLVQRVDTQGNNYYWLGGKAEENDTCELADLNVVKNKYISVTPVRLDFTCGEFKKILEKNGE